MRAFLLIILFSASAFSEINYFESMDSLLPAANEVRLGSGAPGPKYWQQQVDYKMTIELDEDKRSLKGKSTVTYHNNSPHTLKYLWLQLDQNIRKKDSDKRMVDPGSSLESGDYSMHHFKGKMLTADFKGGVNITSATDAAGAKLKTLLTGTMMKIILPKALKSGEKFVFKLEWNLLIVDAKVLFSRTGFEYFKKDGNCIFTIAQWYPRLAAYSDTYGWHTQQFIWAEFALEFGNFDVKITVPSDHIVSATGELTNPKEVLTPAQVENLIAAKNSEKSVVIVSKEEVLKKIKKKSDKKLTWHFIAKNVRDFAFASSRRFIWDGMNSRVGKNNVLCMSFYPPEADSLWSKYSSHAVSHALKVYSKFAVDYPYPTAQSVNAPVYGMEYPMISFQAMRPEKDGTYSRSQKYRLISVIIHEVGHNFFPMIINNDERRFAWMDEGFNSFLQYLAETEWENYYHGIGGRSTKGIKAYMSADSDQPIMTKADNIKSLGSNAYSKPSTGLVILRETILGRKVFDAAFKEYCRRWKFKRPFPADFFRSMDDASGRDLTWFWRSWFYSTDHVDIAVEGLEEFEIDSLNPENNKKALKEALKNKLPLTEILDKNSSKLVDRYPELKDFYNSFDPYTVTAEDKKKFESQLKKFNEEEKKLLKSGKIFYVVKVKNVGGVPMPLILTLNYADGSKEVVKIPVTFWRRGQKTMTKMLILDKKLTSVEHDALDETVDTDRSNNIYPPQIVKRKVRLTKGGKGSNDGSGNPMQKEMKKAAKDKK